MTHDPLCEWSTPCIHGENQQHSRDTENLAVPDATYCWMCGADCHCALIAKVREEERDKDLDYRYIAAQAEAQGQRDMLAKCIAAVKEVRNELAHPDWVRLTARDGAQESVNELKRIQRALQEKP